MKPVDSQKLFECGMNYLNNREKNGERIHFLLGKNVFKY